MKKVFLTVLIAACALVSRADGYPYLAFQTLDGAVSTISTSGLTLTYSEGTLTASAAAQGDAQGAGETLTLETARLSRMYFTDTATGVQALSASAGVQTVDVFTADGRRAGRFGSLQEAMARLPKGAYVVKAADGLTVKIALP